MKKLTTVILIVIASTISSAAQEEIKGAYHHASIFAGPTYMANISQLAPSVKLNYEFQNTPAIGYGFSAQFTFSDKLEYLLGAPFYWYPYKNMKFFCVPGIAFVGSVSYSIDTPPQWTSDEINITGNFFLGLGLGWNFDIYTYKPRIILSPIIEFDLINLNELYFSVGVNIEFEFLYLQE